MTSFNRNPTSVNPTSFSPSPSFPPTIGFALSYTSRQRRSGLDRFFLIGFIFLLLFFSIFFFFFFGSFDGWNWNGEQREAKEGWQAGREQKRKPFAVVLFLPSWEDVIECELGFTSIQSLVDTGVSKLADILILTIENETSTTISPQNRFREDLFRLGVIEIIEVRMPVDVKDIDFAKLRVWELEQYHKGS
jgi:hypothetical protein